jgi:hypothetical protein
MTQVRTKPLAGLAFTGFQDGVDSKLRFPRGITTTFFTSLNEIFFVEEGNHCIRRISSNGN